MSNEKYMYAERIQYLAEMITSDNWLIKIVWIKIWINWKIPHFKIISDPVFYNTC